MRRTMDYQIVGDPYCWSHETPSLPAGHATATSVASHERASSAPGDDRREDESVRASARIVAATGA